MSKLIAMQIAANSNIDYVQVDDISESERENMKRIEMASDDLKNKPENIKQKIIEGRLSKIFKKQVYVCVTFSSDIYIFVVCVDRM